MNGNYLIPANTKRGQLILGLFELVDIIIFGTGLLVTLIAVAIMPIDNLTIALIALAPGVITGLLVLPVAYYHNVRQLITEIYKYLTQRNKFVWKGWCLLDEQEDTTK